MNDFREHPLKLDDFGEKLKSLENRTDEELAKALYSIPIERIHKIYDIINKRKAEQEKENAERKKQSDMQQRYLESPVGLFKAYWNDNFLDDELYKKSENWKIEDYRAIEKAIIAHKLTNDYIVGDQSKINALAWVRDRMHSLKRGM